jgi:HPt (histidine-containing phosphotransfer) domain-containing protein
MKKLFDKTKLVDRLMGDEELANMILDKFLEDFPSKYKAMLRAIKKGDVASVNLLANTLNDASANIGALTLRAIAYEIEAVGRSGDLDKADFFISELKEQFEMLKNSL